MPQSVADAAPSSNHRDAAPTSKHRDGFAELSAMDDERRVVHSEAHSDMVRAMIARGLSSYDLTSYAKEPAEPSELTVRGGSAWFFEDWSNSSGPKLERLKPNNP